MGYGFYLYGIFPPPGPRHLDLTGLDKQPVHAHLLDSFVFLYSEAQQERYLASRRNLLGHERVLEEAMHNGYRTLLPLQFGLIIDGWAAVKQQLLDPYAAGLKTLLQQLEGQREVGIKVYWEMAQELETLMSEHDDLRAERDRLMGKSLSMEQVIQIGQAIDEAMGTRKQSVIQVFQEALNPLANQVVENDPLTDTMIYNAAYLIPWDSEPEFGNCVEDLDEKFDGRLRIRYNNFTAPFNFAQLDTLE
jgi:hypothetical protein